VCSKKRETGEGVIEGFSFSGAVYKESSKQHLRGEGKREIVKATARERPPPKINQHSDEGA